MKQATQSGRPRSNYALFLGDLSIFCEEKDIEDAFASYGEIVNVRIQRSKETSRTLSYGFIEFSCETAAVTAMNEMNSFVLKGRPLRIRWAAKRNQPVKSENTALHSAATIFVKFASQTGIIVTEQVLREHFSVYGEVLDTTIRTITIDEAFNRSKGYGFVNFVNNAAQDGLAIAYKASVELQNATVNGINYRCEVGYKHQKNSAPSHSHSGDTESVGAYTTATSGNISLALSHTSASYSGYLPAISPRHFYGHSSNSVSSIPGSIQGMSGSPSHSSSGPPSPHPASYYASTVPPQAVAMSSSASVHSTGSGSASGVYTHHSGNHSPHPMSVSGGVPTVSFVPTAASMPQQQAQGMYAQPGQQTVPPQQVPQMQYIPVSPANQQQYMQQQQFFAQQQQQQFFAQQQYYGQPAAAYAPHSPSHGHAGHAQYYPAAPQTAPYYGAGQPQQQQQAPQDPHQYYAQQQQYYQQAPQRQGHMPPAGVRPPAVYEPQTPLQLQPPQQQSAQGTFLSEQALAQHKQTRNRRGSLGPPVATAPNYAMHPHAYMQHVYVSNVPEPAGAGPTGRRSQRTISNKSNISEITSATLDELQGYEEEDEDLPEEEQQGEGQEEEEYIPASPVTPATPSVSAPATATAPVPTSAAATATEAPAAAPSKAAATTDTDTTMPALQHLKSTLQTQATTAPTANCKLMQRRNRSVSGGSNTTEVTAAVLYVLQMQEQRLDKEEEEEGFTEPPKTQDDARLTTTPTCASPNSDTAVVGGATKAVTPTPKALLAAANKHIRAAGTPRSPPNAAGSPSPATAAGRVARRPSQSISPFTLSASALAQLQADAEAADSSALPERRNKRNLSDRSNQSDITAALAFMQVDHDQFASLALEDFEEDEVASSAASVEVSVCVCGKAAEGGSAHKGTTGSPYSCPFGTTACSCVYKALS